MILRGYLKLAKPLSKLYISLIGGFVTPMAQLADTILEQLLHRDVTKDPPIIATKEQLADLETLLSPKELFDVSSRFASGHIPDLSSQMQAAITVSVARDIGDHYKIPEFDTRLRRAITAFGRHGHMVSTFFQSTYGLTENASLQNTGLVLNDLNRISTEIAYESELFRADKDVQLVLPKLTSALKTARQIKREVGEYVRGLVWALHFHGGDLAVASIKLKAERARKLMELSPELAVSYLKAPLAYLKEEFDWESINNDDQPTKRDPIYLLASKENQVYSEILCGLKLKKKEPKLSVIKNVPPTVSVPVVRREVPEVKQPEISPRDRLYQELTAHIRDSAYLERAKRFANKIPEDRLELALRVYSRRDGFDVPDIMRKKPLTGEQQRQFFHVGETRLIEEKASKRFAREDYQFCLRLKSK